MAAVAIVIPYECHLSIIILPQLRLFYFILLRLRHLLEAFLLSAVYCRSWEVGRVLLLSAEIPVPATAASKSSVSALVALLVSLMRLWLFYSTTSGSRLRS